MDHREGLKGLAAYSQTFPTDAQPAILFLKPGTRALGLEAWALLLDRFPTGGSVFQTRVGVYAQIPPLRSCWRRALASYPLSIAMTCRRFRGRPLHRRLCQGKTSHRRPRTASASGLVVRRYGKTWPASARGFHRPASAATTDALDSSTPGGDRWGHPIGGSLR